MSEMVERRALLKGLGALICAPAIVRVSSLMPVRAWRDAATSATFTTSATNMSGADLIVGIVGYGDCASITDNLGNTYELVGRSKRGAAWRVLVPPNSFKLIDAALK